MRFILRKSQGFQPYNKNNEVRNLGVKILS